MMIKRPINSLSIRIFVELGYFMYKLPLTSPKCIEALFAIKKKKNKKLKKHAFFEKNQFFIVLHASKMSISHVSGNTYQILRESFSQYM